MRNRTATHGFPRRTAGQGLRWLPALLLCLLLPAACSDDVESLYANIRAFFRFTPVTQVPGLRDALNSPGMFCTITFPNGKYRFEFSHGQPYTYTPTAADLYGKPECVSGFIVGTPAVPDLNGNFYNVAFDLVCSNCYSEQAIQRNLTVSAATASCNRCGRSYDLNNGGIVSSHQGGRSLYRYHISYTGSQDLLLIQN